VDLVGRIPDGTLVLTDRETGRDDDEYETEFQVAAVQPWAGEVVFGRIVEWASSGHALTGVFYESERYL
jgi:DNA-directed RNA polymerase subunit E'/Rpb7